MDERLAHSPKELAKHPDPLPRDPSCQAGFGHVNKTYVLLKSEADIRRVWKPDVFVDQAVTIRYNWPMISLFSISCCSRTPKFDEAPQSIKVYENHVVRFSKRINFDIGCQMNFTKYPVDMQICEIKFESFSYKTSVIFKVFSIRNIHMYSICGCFRRCFLSGTGWRAWLSTRRSTCQATSTRLKRSVTRISHSSKSMITLQENELKLSNYAVPFSNMRFKLFLVRQVEDDI